MEKMQIRRQQDGTAFAEAILQDGAASGLGIGHTPVAASEMADGGLDRAAAKDVQRAAQARPSRDGLER